MRRALVVAALLLAGCAESRITAPADGSFDVAAAGRANASMSALVSGPGMSGVAALDGRMPAELVGPAAVPGLSSAGAAGLPALALRLLRSLPGAGGPLAVQVIRPGVLGHTYTYDPAAHRYAPDPARAGAPGNGVRFILYAVDPGSHEPQVDHETGYADLTDLSPPGFSVGLRFRAVSSGKAFLDYSFTLTPSFSGGALSVSGFLSDDQDRLDFTIAAAGAAIGGNQAAHVSFDLAVPSQRFHATGAVDAASGAEGAAAHVEIMVAIGADVVRLSGESNPSAVNAALSVNGHLFASITGDPQHPTVRGEGGRELSPEEVTALGGLVGVVYGVIEMFEHLLEPVAGLLGISVSL